MSTKIKEATIIGKTWEDCFRTMFPGETLCRLQLPHMHHEDTLSVTITAFSSQSMCISLSEEGSLSEKGSSFLNVDWTFV